MGQIPHRKLVQVYGFLSEQFVVVAMRCYKQTQCLCKTVPLLRSDHISNKVQYEKLHRYFCFWTLGFTNNI